MNRPPLTTMTVIEIEDVIDLAKRYFASGNVIDEAEFGHLMVELEEAYHAADHADASVRLGMSWMHNGPEARRSRDLQKSYEQTHNAGEPIDIDRYRKTKKRPNRPTGPSAA